MITDQQKLQEIFQCHLVLTQVRDLEEEVVLNPNSWKEKPRLAQRVGWDVVGKWFTEAPWDILKRCSGGEGEET